LRRLAASGTVTDQRATEAASDLSNTRLVRYPHAPLRERVWELRHRLTAYDAAYLALAEALDDTVLLTGDGGLAARAQESLGDDRVRHVA
jgi:predicted nucleic acid-binding protein